MDARLFGLENPIFSTVQHLMNIPEEMKSFNAPTRTYVTDAKAMAATPADVKELPGSYVFLVDMPGVKPGALHVQVEDSNVLVVSGERAKEDEKECKYIRMERRVGKFMRKFLLPENADTDKVLAECKDGVLKVSVEKLLPPEKNKARTIEVKTA